jgi:hypothetical protein
MKRRTAWEAYTLVYIFHDCFKLSQMNSYLHYHTDDQVVKAGDPGPV